MEFSASVFSLKYSGLCRKAGLSPRKALKEIFGMDGSNLQKWANNESIPKADIVFAVAEYFDVSMDFLLGRSVPTYLSAPENFRPEEIQLINSLRLTSSGTREIALAALRAILDTATAQHEKEKKQEAAQKDDAEEAPFQDKI